MEQRKYLVLKDFVRYPSGILCRKGSIYTPTTYFGSPYIKAMKKHGFIAVATEEDIKSAARKQRNYQQAKKRVAEWKRSI